MASVKQLSLTERLGVLVLNILGFALLNWWITGAPVPSPGISSLWFFSAITLWFLSLVTSPWFLPPRDALASGVTGFIVVATIDLSTAWYPDELGIIRMIAAGLAIFIVVLSIAAIVLHENSPNLPATKLTFRVSSEFGRPELVFTLIALIGIVGFYANDPMEVAILTGAWAIALSIRPIELLWIAFRNFFIASQALEKKSASGTILRVDHPGLFRVALPSHKDWKPGTLKIAALPDGSEEYVVALFSQTQGTQIVGTGLAVAEVAEQRGLSKGSVVDSHDPEAATRFLATLSGVPEAKLVGFCVENSEISQLRFEAANNALLSDGAIIFANVRGRPVFYQIVEARTSEESFDQNPKGSQIVTAVQLGEYDPVGGFSKFDWLPEMNAPIFFSEPQGFTSKEVATGEIEVGRLPGIEVPITADVKELVTHHIAVLGATGTGKTEFAFNVIEQLLHEGTKVLCVDFTGDYRTRFADLEVTLLGPSEERGAELEQKLFDVETGTYGAPAEKRILEDALRELRADAEAQIEAFVSSEDQGLAIFELAEIANTQASLRITELYLSAVMRYAKLNRGFGNLLIVLEEAHTIVPEARGAGFDFPTQWIVSRIGQIALQGRKYGIGLMVISQRTALVSKTILSQCNAFFVFSLIDSTSLSFLESIFSIQQTRLIPNLKRFHALIGGKSLSTERPVVIDLTRQ